MKKLYYVVALAVLHFLFTIFFIVWSFSETMSRFDSGQAPTVISSILNIVTQVLTFPLVLMVQTFSKYITNTLFEYILFFLNSFLWSWIIVSLSFRLKSTKIR
ncbi:MAG TPA: hypothetical protein VD998_01090 [Verrucomicrobiae bacterium]|nr:hypothetical protein [Verrucomicrobiae bacterium]